ncbi:SctK family type III secretion system sorting platform protein [Pseudomonas plecoglossicida]
MTATNMPLTDYQLRFCPASYMHDSHVPRPLLGWLKRLPGWRQQPPINAWLLGELILPTHYDMPQGLAKIAFFERPELERIMTLVGAILHGGAIRQLMDGKSLQPVHAAIGEAGHRFCLEQLDYIIGPWPAGWQQRLPTHELSEYFLHYGLVFWLFAMGDADEAFSRRLALRIPKRSCVEPLPFNPLDAGLARALCLKITRKVSPACVHLLK